MNRANRLHAAFLEAYQKPASSRRSRVRLRRLNALACAAMIIGYGEQQQEMEV